MSKKYQKFYLVPLDNKLDVDKQTFCLFSLDPLANCPFSIDINQENPEEKLFSMLQTAVRRLCYKFDIEAAKIKIRRLSYDKFSALAARKGQKLE